MRTVKSSTSTFDLALGWVHPSVVNDENAAKAHAVFITGHLAGGLAALMLFPLWLAVNRSVSAIEAGVFFWLVSPIFLSAFVSRSGRLDWGINGSLMLFSGFIAWFCTLTGGLNSAGLLWLCILPIEAALFGGRKTVVSGIILALAGFGTVLVADNLFPASGFRGPGVTYLTAYQYSVFGAMLYGGVLAFRLDRRRRVAKALVMVEEGKFRLLAENSTDLITQHAENGDIQFASSVSSNLLNCSAESLFGRGLFERVHLHDRIKFLSAFSNELQCGNETAVTYRAHLPVSEPGDIPTIIWLETRCRKIPDPATGRAEIVAVTRDVSDIKKTEESLNQQRSEAEASNEAKSRFLASMSHELRTPLNAIIGFSDILKQDLFGKFEYDKHSEYVELINESGHHLLNLVNGILDISKIEAGKYQVFPESFNLPVLIDSVCAMLTPQSLAKEITVKVSIVPQLPELKADPRACKQILINLLSNAIKFSYEGSSVEIGAKPVKGSVEIYVKDEGIGISKENLEAIGQPFHQLDNKHTRNYEGTGLGLYLVKGLVELHEGQFNISCNSGKGTRVAVVLPVEPARSQPVPAIEDQTLVRLESTSRKPKPQPFRSNENAIVQAKIR